MSKMLDSSILTRIKKLVTGASQIEGLGYSQKLQVALLIGLMEGHAVLSECQHERDELARTLERLGGQSETDVALRKVINTLEKLVESLMGDPDIQQLIVDADRSSADLARLSIELWKRLDSQRLYPRD